MNDTHVVCVNSPIVIECTITLNTAIGPDLSVINYYWYHNDSLIEDSTTDKDTILSTQISISLPGTYTCKANIAGSDQTKIVSLDVKLKGIIFVYYIYNTHMYIIIDIPVITLDITQSSAMDCTPHSSRCFYPGDNVTITCSSSSNSHYITGPNGINTSSLTIEHFDSSAVGNYTCTSSNECGMNSSTVNLRMISEFIYNN